MKRNLIDIHDLIIKPGNIWENDWFLLTVGDFESGQFNTMTVAWGSLGTMWSKPFAQVVIRPSRYTRDFMERFDTFTLSRLPEEYKKAMKFLGTKSGRDISNKHKEVGLTPISVPHVQAPAFDEANLIIACKKIYWQDMDKKNFLDERILLKYEGDSDSHRIYFGEIMHTEVGDF